MILTSRSHLWYSRSLDFNQWLAVRDRNSSSECLCCGVPQRSVLGPLVCLSDLKEKSTSQSVFWNICPAWFCKILKDPVLAFITSCLDSLYSCSSRRDTSRLQLIQNANLSHNPQTQHHFSFFTQMTRSFISLLIPPVRQFISLRTHIRSNNLLQLIPDKSEQT